jgi:hypothetical protein
VGIGDLVLPFGVGEDERQARHQVVGDVSATVLAERIGTALPTLRGDMQTSGYQTKGTTPGDIGMTGTPKK